MTLGNDIYNKVQCDEKYNIYIEALKHDEHPKSIINIIDELHDKRTTPLPQKEHFEQFIYFLFSKFIINILCFFFFY